MSLCNFYANSNMDFGDSAPADKSPIETPANVAELRESDQARRMFPGSSMYSGVKFDNAPQEATPEERQQLEAAHDELREIFADLSISAPEAQGVVDLFRQYRGEQRPSAEQQAEWQRASADALHRAYGEGAPAALADVSALLKRDPRTARMVEQAGLGDHPALVQLFARAARAERLAGRLK